MNRREALKNIGLSFGFLVGAPTAVSILQGCSGTTADTNWEPRFFTAEEFDAVTKVVDIILPATENAPSASEVNVHQFIDKYLNEVVSVEEQELTKQYLGKFMGMLEQKSGGISNETIEPFISDSLGRTPEEEQKILDKIQNYVEAQEAGREAELMDDVASYALLTNLRGLTIWSYKTSETVGEKILAYESVPGRQEGCVDLEEATGGRAWSL